MLDLSTQYLEELIEELIEDSYVNSRLYEIAGSHYEYCTSTRHNKDTNTYEKLHFMREVDKTKPQLYRSLIDYRLLREAVVRNDLTVVHTKDDCWVAVKGSTYCKASFYENAVYGCILKLLDTDQWIADLAPISRYVKTVPNDISHTDPFVDDPQAERVTIEHRKAIEPDPQIVIKKNV